VETAAAVEIDKGSLRHYFLDDFHSCLEKPSQNRSGFPTVTTGPAATLTKAPYQSSVDHYKGWLRPKKILRSHLSGADWVVGQSQTKDFF